MRGSEGQAAEASSGGPLATCFSGVPWIPNNGVKERHRRAPRQHQNLPDDRFIVFADPRVAEYLRASDGKSRLAATALQFDPGSLQFSSKRGLIRLYLAVTGDTLG